MNLIRNFCIIAHIDHGKSTLADRFLELTGTVEKRKMREQFLDKMDLERERGITIKMQPVRMNYKLRTIDYQLNLIDTPGHIDFQYEVSRALMAVEGAILLVDATKGVQAQTISNLELAQKSGLAIIPVVNKIDSPQANVNEAKKEIENLLGISESEIYSISAKTGEGVNDVLLAILEKVPPPKVVLSDEVSALIFDSFYSSHKGVLAHVRVFSGTITKNKKLKLFFKNYLFSPIEIGILNPDFKETDLLKSGEIGYLATNIKDPLIVRVGDTIVDATSENSVPKGEYKEPKPVVWANILPKDSDDFISLKDAFDKLRLNDSSLFYDVESSVWGRSLRVGFLGLLHLEITVERISREFDLDVIVASPSVEYEAVLKNGEKKLIRNSIEFDGENVEFVLEPIYIVSIMGRAFDLGKIMRLSQKFGGVVSNTKSLSREQILVESTMPLRSVVSGFFDLLKSATQGYGSMNYEFFEKRKVDLVKLEVFVAEKSVPQFAELVPKGDAQRRAKEIIEKLAHTMPRQLFALKLQAGTEGRIYASHTLSAVGKNVTAKLYGGDRTRKMKLWKKQKKGKKRLQEHAQVEIPHDVYLKMIKRD